MSNTTRHTEHSTFATVPLRSKVDRLRQIMLFELFGLLFITPLFALIADETLAASIVLLVLLAIIALAWNALYATLFDRLERRIARRAADCRPHSLRLLHAAGFEAGLLVFTLPVIMAWTGMDFWQALVADIGLVLVYVGYAYVYNLAYDRVFPLHKLSSSPFSTPDTPA